MQSPAFQEQSDALLGTSHTTAKKKKINENVGICFHNYKGWTGKSEYL
jgi:hypothetical protein